ncbi:MAG: Uma2 family endonuclease [Dehalococcoidia bacterium]
MTATAVMAPPETWPDLPERDGYEYVDGRWVKLPVAAATTWIGFNVRQRLADAAATDDLGWVPAPHETAFQIWPGHPRRYRKPDASFIRKEAYPEDAVPDGFVHAVPALVVEVVSPRDIAADIDRKISEYFEAGVELIWVLHPASQTVMVYRLDSSGRRLKAEDTLTGDAVLPGFHAKVADLFSLRIR